MKFCIYFLCLFSMLSCKKIEGTIPPKINIINLESPSSENCAQPYLFAHKENLLISWTEKINDSLARLQYANLTDTLWSKPHEIARDTNWFVNWADFPAIAENESHLLSHFLQKSANGTYTYDVRMKLSDKKTVEWTNDFILHSDGTQSEHGFVTIIPYKETSFFVTWLDGRKTTGSHDHQGQGAMTIRVATVLSDGKIIEEEELDAKTCDCCQTSATITEKGPVVVYRDRSENEIRDISICRFIDGQWTTPKSIHDDLWKIEGCPVNGPKISSFKNNVAVAWYTAANEIPKVKVVFSRDHGETFDDPIIIDKIKTIGRVDLAFLNQDEVLASWVSSENSKTVIKVMKINAHGKMGSPITVSEFDPSRSSGFPQLEILKQRAYLAWTDVSGEKQTIKTAYINLENL
ncbi:MAG: hypothetical protein HKN90_01750 [Flavobacteriaceae bacterium]|nr:hypothetical protein [Flavobacteriaceae bacterium]